MHTYEHVRLMCAMAAHEANRVYCRAVGDLSQVVWDDAEEHQRQSALEGVDAVFAGQGPRQLHESWMGVKAAAGWVFGKAKDSEKKTHPCMIPYDELPSLQKWKDVVFLNSVHTMAAALEHPVPQAVPSFGVSDQLLVKPRPA